MSTDIVPAAQTTNSSGDGIATRAAASIDARYITEPPTWRNHAYNRLALLASAIGAPAVALVALNDPTGVPVAFTAGGVMLAALVIRPETSETVCRYIYRNPA